MRSPSANARSTADSTAAASASNAKPWRSISAADRNMASGLATPRPAMSGAEPCTGSNMPGVARRSPSEALGSIPIEPVIIAASSERMSPNMFSVTITSKCAGRRDQLHGGVVDEQMLELDVRELGARGRPVTTSRQSRYVSSTLALSTLVTSRRARPAKATRAIRSISARV